MPNSSSGDSDENNFYDSDTFVSDKQQQSNARTKVVSQPVFKSKREKNTKQIYLGTSKGQRTTNKRPLNKQLHPASVEVNTQRLLSARNHRINDQSNAIHQLTLQIEELKNENKTLKTQFYRQEKALIKIDSKQTDFPKILDQHEAEVLSLKELIRRNKESLAVEVRQRKEGDAEILKLRDNLARANILIGEKNLDERSVLQAQINDLQEKLESKEKVLENSSKHIEYLDKTHKREIYSLKKTVQKCMNQCQTLENELELTKNNLKEKEKLLEIQNIYSQRFKAVPRATGTSGPQSEQLLDKLDFGVLNNKTDKKEKEETAHNSKTNTQRSTTRIDTDKIKEDIRRIVEEEISAGRIKAVEFHHKPSSVHLEDSSHIILDREPSNAESTVPPSSNNTDRLDESQIFDKDPLTQVQTIADQSVEPIIDQEVLEYERLQRQLILTKLNELDADDSSQRMYSYPHDYLGNEEEPISEIETIAATNEPSTTKVYKFSSTVDSLHNGTPVHPPNNRHKEDHKSRKTSQIEATHQQRNNSNAEVSQEIVLPVLNSGDKKRRESELLSELFGSDFTPQPVVHGRPYPSGSRQSRAGGSLPWEGEHELRRLPSTSSVAVNQSEDIEQIVL